ncbi:keratin, type I cytoskeletal 10-like isoform X1 [Poeciliopsis prolifica]|uniref:keratin, type I cytoskeletal 10-like isoform X1 n=1 Tax=Poeciliopsis prolifica TaxID=188132 RepID=UPI0024144090|nr:keratin, type I cytoskeletal 10-like isoform X1 [Poeciliopsis prolifica]XP_054881452.1 keratin, type I cytoskeletal 10-like isoform X1 [Poeciliopsis prolifica]XP_054881454.1 keratin, type I cytoskeletal 10-like isoform X1 [Poeciliopsis prolifica]
MNLNLGRRDRRTQEMASSSLPASLFLLSLVFWQFVAAADPVTVKAKVGADVTLPCKTAGDKAIVQAEWSRPDQTSAPVLLYKNNKVDDNQLAAYKGRTSLLDVQKRDLSLVLKKVVSRDAGKYECRVELGEGTAAAGGGTRGGAGGGGTATGGAGGGGTATGGAATGGAATGGAATGGAAAGGAEAGGAAAGGAAAGGAEAGGAEAFDASGGRGRSRARGRVLKSAPISIVILTVEGGSSHGGDGLRPKSVLPVGLLALLALIAGLQ